MDLKGKLKQGMRIFGANNEDYGTVERFDDDYAYVGGRRVPMSAFERMDDRGVYVGRGGTEYFGQGSSTGANQGDVRVQVHEERLDVGKRDVEVGEVGIRKEVVSEQASVPVELRREEAHVEQVNVSDRPVDPNDKDVFQEGTIRVPIRGEEAVVSKQAYVTGEVVVDKSQTTERETISDTVRKERVTVDEDYSRERANLEKAHQARAGSTGRRFEQAEPNYRMGFESAHDDRYRDREFDAAEPDLRREYETRQKSSGSGSGDSWEHLREEIREGWQRARGR